MPEGRAVDGPGLEELGVEAVGGHGAGRRARRRAARRRARPAPRSGQSSRRQPCAQRRMRRAQAAAWVQCAGAPRAICSSISSSVPCRCPTTGTSGATRAAASCSGVRWCRCRTSAPAASARSSAARPGGDVLLVGRVVDRGEARVRRPGPVLVGRVHRRVAGAEVDGARRRGRRRSASASQWRAGSDPATIVTSHPWPGSASARARATCDDPPRGKNISPLTTRRCTAVQS